MDASGGRSDSSLSRRASRLVRSPSASITTPWEELVTHPERSSEQASRYTKGRNPTPWTAPRMAICMRCFKNSVPPRVPPLTVVFDHAEHQRDALGDPLPARMPTAPRQRPVVMVGMVTRVVRAGIRAVERRCRAPRSSPGEQVCEPVMRTCVVGDDRLGSGVPVARFGLRQ